MSQSTSVIAVSLDLETLNYLSEYGKTHGNMSRSQSVRYHIRMGRTYMKIMEEQFQEQKEKYAEEHVVDTNGKGTDIV